MYAWSVCRSCPNARASPRRPLSSATLGMSLGRFLESNFYNTGASSRTPGCSHPLHLHHERFIAYGSLCVSVRLQQCVVFGITPPLGPRDLCKPCAPPPPPPPLQSAAQAASLRCEAAVAAHALIQPLTLTEVAKGVAAVSAAAAAAATSEGGHLLAA